MQISASTEAITLQHLEKASGDNPVVLETLAAVGQLCPFAAFVNGAHVDALFKGTGTSLPPAVILDYMYGIATYQHWGNRQSRCVVVS